MIIKRTLQLDIDEAEAGMVLSDAVLDGQGGLLVASGATLTESTLQSLRRRGIDTLSVLNDRISEEELAAERQRHQQRLAKLFRKYASDADNKLLQIITQYRIGEEA